MSSLQVHVDLAMGPAPPATAQPRVIVSLVHPIGSSGMPAVPVLLSVQTKRGRMEMIAEIVGRALHRNM
jgi:hypothetical protein